MSYSLPAFVLCSKYKVFCWVNTLLYFSCSVYNLNIIYAVQMRQSSLHVSQHDNISHVDSFVDWSVNNYRTIN